MGASNRNFSGKSITIIDRGRLPVETALPALTKA